MTLEVVPQQFDPLERFLVFTGHPQPCPHQDDRAKALNPASGLVPTPQPMVESLDDHAVGTSITCRIILLWASFSSESPRPLRASGCAPSAKNMGTCRHYYYYYYCCHNYYYDYCYYFYYCHYCYYRFLRVKVKGSSRVLGLRVMGFLRGWVVVWLTVKVKFSIIPAKRLPYLQFRGSLNTKP